MALDFNLTEDDFLRGKLVDPGHHHCKIVGYEEKTSTPKADPKNPGQMTQASRYAELKFLVLDGKDKGAVLYNNFSEKAPGFIVPFLEALMGGKKMEQKSQTQTFTKEKLMNQYIDVEVKRGEYQGKPQNQVVGFKPFSGTKE